MPTYQYACTSPECANRFEVVQAFTDPAVSQCPICAEPVRKVYGSVGVVFKGAGFYLTDSRSEKARNSGDGAGTKKEDAGAKKDGAGDSPSTSKGSDTPAPATKASKSPVAAATS
jgi:putative FmdB family regulatory protein